MKPPFYTLRSSWVAQFGFEKAAILERVNDWTRWVTNDRLNEHEGRYWFFHSLETWIEELSCIPERTFQRLMSELLADGLVERRVGGFGKDRTTFYRINTESADLFPELAHSRQIGANSVKRHSRQNGANEERSKNRAKRHSRQNGANEETECEASSIAANLAPMPYLREEIEQRDLFDEPLAQPPAAPASALVVEAASPVPVETKAAPRNRAKKAKEPSEGTEVWNAYGKAYQGRYGRPPVRNAKQNALCSQLALRLGSDAPAVAAFFVTHGARFYVQALHPLGLLVRDAEAMHTQWAAGRTVTETVAKRLEEASASDDVAARVAARFIQERRAAGYTEEGDQ